MKNPFKLPTPKELGKSKSNALPMKDFTPWSDEYSWEDWHVEVKNTYPIRYALSQTIPKFFKVRISMPIGEAWYWFKSHVFPSRRYHLLDLRQPCGDGDIKNIDCYKYGWCDVPERMLYAIFNLLKEYFDEEPFDLTTKYSREEINADPVLKNQQDCYDEAKAILYWWQVERKQESLNIYKLLSTWSVSRKDDASADDPETTYNMLQLRHAEMEFEKKNDEMIARLMRIRRGLWT